MSRCLLLLLSLLAWLTGCEPRQGDGSRVDNRPPQTHLSVGYFRADSAVVDTLGLSSSRVGLSWWGEDADGWIDHYEYRWLGEADTTEAAQAAVPWTSTSQESDTFVVHLTRDVMVVRFQVRAVDNEGGTDESPALTVFPAFNQRPRVDWVAASQELLPGIHPDTSWTFGHNTFHYNVWDLDGNETITRVIWALDDTSSWTDLPLGLGAIPLTPEQLAPGPHRVFLKAKDIADAWSTTLVYPPAPDSSGTALVWMVRPMAGSLLVAFDDAVATQGPATVRQALGAIDYVEDQDYTFWDVTDWVPYDEQDFQAILESYSMLFWVSYMTTQLETVCENLDLFMAREGRLLIGTTDMGYLSGAGNIVLFDNPCLPIDALTHERHFLYPLPSRDNPITPAAPFLTRYPVLRVTERISMRGNNDLDFGFTPDDSSSVELYFVPEDPAHAGNPRVTLAARRAADGLPDKAKELFFTLPLWQLTPLDSLFRAVIEDDFNW